MKIKNRNGKVKFKKPLEKLIHDLDLNELNNKQVLELAGGQASINDLWHKFRNTLADCWNHHLSLTERNLLIGAIVAGTFGIGFKLLFPSGRAANKKLAPVNLASNPVSGAPSQNHTEARPEAPEISANNSPIGSPVNQKNATDPTNLIVSRSGSAANLSESPGSRLISPREGSINRGSFSGAAPYNKVGAIDLRDAIRPISSDHSEQEASPRSYNSSASNSIDLSLSPKNQTLGGTAHKDVGTITTATTPVNNYIEDNPAGGRLFYQDHKSVTSSPVKDSKSQDDSLYKSLYEQNESEPPLAIRLKVPANTTHNVIGNESPIGKKAHSTDVNEISFDSEELSAKSIKSGDDNNGSDMANLHVGNTVSIQASQSPNHNEVKRLTIDTNAQKELADISFEGSSPDTPLKNSQLQNAGNIQVPLSAEQQPILNTYASVDRNDEAVSINVGSPRITHHKPSQDQGLPSPVHSVHSNSQYQPNDAGTGGAPVVATFNVLEENKSEYASSPEKQERQFYTLPDLNVKNSSAEKNNDGRPVSVTDFKTNIKVEEKHTTNSRSSKGDKRIKMKPLPLNISGFYAWHPSEVSQNFKHRKKDLSLFRSSKTIEIRGANTPHGNKLRDADRNKRQLTSQNKPSSMFNIFNTFDGTKESVFRTSLEVNAKQVSNAKSNVKKPKKT